MHVASVPWPGQDRFSALVDEKGTREIAQLLNVSNSSISHYRSGRRRPSIEDLVTLARHYRISLDWLTHLNDIDRGAHDESVVQVPLLQNPYSLLGRTPATPAPDGKTLTISRTNAQLYGYPLIAVRATGWVSTDMVPMVMPRDTVLMSDGTTRPEIIEERSYLVRDGTDELKLRVAYACAAGWIFSPLNVSSEARPFHVHLENLDRVISIVVAIVTYHYPLG